MKLMLKNNHIFSLFLFTNTIVLAQNTKEEYKKIKEKYNTPEFDYKIEETTPQKNINSDWLEQLMRLLNLINWEIVMFCLIGLVFCLVLYKLYKNGLFFQLQHNHKVDDNEIHFEFIEDNLLNIDLNQLIQQSKKESNYRLAIRYYHYQNTQNLAQKNHLIWDPKKTNQQLINEIKNQDIKTLFQQNTKIFNKVWFGNISINEEDFKQYENKYKNLNQSL